MSERHLSPKEVAGQDLCPKEARNYAAAILMACDWAERKEKLLPTPTTPGAEAQG